MRFQLSCAAALALSATLLGCAPTDVQTGYEHDADIARPERVLVYDFAVSADQVQLDRGIRSRLQQALSGTPPTEAELQLGRSTAGAISEELVARIQAMGLAAERASGAPGRWAGSLVIEGQLLSVDEGNKTRQRLIGLGAGHSDVDAEVQIFTTASDGLRQVADFTANARSGYKPGAAETMGVGAATGGLAASAALTAAGDSGLSEQLSTDVSADGKRMAAAIAEKLQGYFVQQGWIAPQ